MKKVLIVIIIIIIVLGIFVGYLSLKACHPIYAPVQATHRITGTEKVFGNSCEVPFWYKEGSRVPLDELTDVEDKTLSDSVVTSNWQTYRNEEYGFEFNYPEPFSIDNKGGLVLNNDKGESVFEMGLSSTQPLMELGFDTKTRELLYREGTIGYPAKSDINCTQPLYENEDIPVLKTTFGDAFDVHITYHIFTSNNKSITISLWESVPLSVGNIVQLRGVNETEAQKIFDEYEKRKVKRVNILETFRFVDPSVQPIEFTCRAIDEASLGPRG